MDNLPKSSVVLDSIKCWLRRVLSRLPKPPRQYSLEDCEAKYPEDTIGVNKSILSEIVLRISRIIGTCPYPLDEQMLMGYAFIRSKPDIVLDCGTNVGKSARFFYEFARQVRHPCEVHTIDLMGPTHPECPWSSLGRYIRGLPITQHIGDSYEIGIKLIEAFPARRYLIFIDGDHTYAGVKKDIQLLDRAKPGSAALFHDATFFLPKLSPDICRAIDEYVEAYPVAYVYHQGMGLPGMSYVQK